MRRWRFNSLVTPALVALVGVSVLIRVLVTEEHRPQRSSFKKYSAPSGLEAGDLDYLQWAQGHITEVVDVAGVRSMRYKCIAFASGLSALAIPVTLLMSLPALVPAILGLLAAAGQLYQGLFRDREQAHLGHQLAVKGQKALRDFHVEATRLEGDRLRQRFDEFRKTFEAIKEEYGSEFFKIRSQEPPLPSGKPA